jgi:hypothetical protein
MADRNLKVRKKEVRQSYTYPKATKDDAIQHGVQQGDVMGAFEKTRGFIGS